MAADEGGREKFSLHNASPFEMEQDVEINVEEIIQSTFPKLEYVTKEDLVSAAQSTLSRVTHDEYRQRFSDRSCFEVIADPERDDQAIVTCTIADNVHATVYRADLTYKTDDASYIDGSLSSATLLSSTSGIKVHALSEFGELRRVDGSRDQPTNACDRCQNGTTTVVKFVMEMMSIGVSVASYPAMVTACSAGLSTLATMTGIGILAIPFIVSSCAAILALGLLPAIANLPAQWLAQAMSTFLCQHIHTMLPAVFDSFPRFSDLFPRHSPCDPNIHDLTTCYGRAPHWSRANDTYYRIPMLDLKRGPGRLAGDQSFPLLVYGIDRNTSEKRLFDTVDMTRDRSMQGNLNATLGWNLRWENEDGRIAIEKYPHDAFGVYLRHNALADDAVGGIPIDTVRLQCL
ncbi:MAG: hypothetical protein ACPGUV_01520 [Polyangiales bacterium]